MSGAFAGLSECPATCTLGVVLFCNGPQNRKERATVAAEINGELIRFEPKMCSCNRNALEFKRESASVMRDFC